MRKERLDEETAKIKFVRKIFRLFLNLSKKDGIINTSNFVNFRVFL